MSAPIRPELHRRFVAIVARGLARAAREHAEHLAALHPAKPVSAEERRRVHDRISAPTRRRPTTREENA